ncbi:MAG: hypothetical protein Fur005_12910 [Roseiflexaceae bacterium]
MRQSLFIQLNRLSFERWSRRSLRTMLRAGWLALCVWCAGIGLNLLLGNIPDLPLIGGVALAVLAAGVVAILFDRRLPPEQVARRLDRRFQLHEQLSTALEWANRPNEPESIASLLLDESSQTLRQVRRQVVQRQQTPWSDLIALIALAFVAAGLFVLVGVGRPLAYDEPLPLPPLVGDAEIPPDEAFAPPTSEDSPGLPGVGSEGESLQPSDQPGQEGQGDQSGQGSATGSGNGQQAPGQPQQDQQGQNGSDQPAELDPTARQNLDAIADALRDQGATRPAAEALDQGNLDAAAQELRELADQADQLSEQTRQELANALRNAASQIQSSDPDLAQQLRESARGLERGDDRAAEALDNLAQAIEQQAGAPTNQSGQQNNQNGEAGQQPGGDGEQAGDASNTPSGQQGQAGINGESQGDQPGGGNGAGMIGAGEQRAVENPQRLGADGQPVPLDLPPGQGTSGNGANRATAGGVSAVGSTGGGSAGATQGNSGPDPLRVPVEERDVVQDYFTP